MYVLPGVFLALCIVFVFLNHFRKRKIIKRICSMDSCEKQELLQELIEPFGFSYNPCEDIFSSAVDSWQREFGYRAFFDRVAPRFHMVFDCEPVYFDYDDQTWLIEFWKGQYGINTGAEIGVYSANKLLSPRQRSSAAFYSVPDSQMLPMSFDLTYCQKPLFQTQGLHWWLTGFRMGKFSRPGDLAMHVSITFPDCSMMQSFTAALQKLGYDSCSFCTCNNTVSFTFLEPHTRQKGWLRKLRKRWAQWKNHLFVRLYCRITRVYSCTVDRLLYLYYFLPFAFRRTVKIRCTSRKKNRYLRRGFRSAKREHRKCSARNHTRRKDS